VKREAQTMLRKWFEEDCHGSHEALLKALEPETHTETALSALESIVSFVAFSTHWSVH